MPYRALHLGGGRRPEAEATIALQVKREALEEPGDIAQPVAAALEHLELVGEPFDKATRLPVENVVRNQIKPTVEHTKQRVCGHVFFGGHIGTGARDQLHYQMALVGFGTQRFRVIPVEVLGGGGMVVTARTDVARPLTPYDDSGSCLFGGAGAPRILFVR